MMTTDRKQDTREKIKLGGLVKKAGLAQLPTATLLGLLLEQAEKLKTPAAETIKQAWASKGDVAFSTDSTE